MMTNTNKPSSDFVTPELLAKYDKPGPRYTSYPTALEFTDSIGASHYHDQLALLQRTDDAISIYVHIPFCKSRCHFCGCHTALCNNPDEMEEYVSYLCKEIELVKNRLGEHRAVAAIHFGGGTPTYLSDTQLAEIMNTIKANFTLRVDAEVSVEVNPGVSSVTQIDFLSNLGFNRISLGVQDFNADVLKGIGRHQTKEDTVRITEAARRVGFTSVNMDLIYGLPFQTKQTFAQTLEELLELRPDRVALYSFAFIPWIRENQNKLDESALPSRDDKYAFFAMALNAFLGSDYLQIGMDHFALRSDELGKAAVDGKLFRNFMGYTVTKSKDSVGLGVSSIGYVRGAFFQNEKENKAYYAAIDKEQLPIFKGLVLGTDDLIRANVIAELMCNFKLDIKDFEKKWSINFSAYFSDELSQFATQREDSNPFTILDNALRLTEVGKVFVRNVCMVFDTYLKTKKKDRPLFSRTI